VWRRYTSSGLQDDIRGARVTPKDRCWIPGIPDFARRSVYDPVVAFDGNNYIVIWHTRCNDYRNIIGAVVSPAGAVLDTFVVSALPWDKTGCAVGSGPGGQPLMAFTMWTDSVNHHPAGAQRIWGRVGVPTGVSESRGCTFVACGLLPCPIRFAIGPSSPMSLLRVDR